MSSILPAINGVRDIGISDGKIVSVSQNLQAAQELVDVSGKYVCPRSIDLHGHCTKAVASVLSEYLLKPWRYNGR